MKEIIGLAVLASGLFGAALGLGGYGLLRHRKRLLYLAAASASLSLLVASWTAYRAFYKSYRHVAEAVRPRNGAEIYAALFGRSSVACTQVIESQDQVIPRIDYAIWLHFKTCPSEFKRLLARHPFDGDKVPTAQWLEKIPGAGNIQWFRPQAMGDTILVYEYATANSRNIQTFWASRDSTEVFYRDIAD
ncbi:hypothetical protein GKZ68_08140 [Hymenobacter sp. BRD128]|uniref:hypothetical protein n=1 Tax=Hymenobacter sp. BRD128 TaxID=2675878 RepID=UPI0015645A2F|nr:hypothetical protein [Hymenobacter sp. BRD128]QKG56601.1 hypothetical protein GKZ68_08140 [Hymenobacter sp. BRD128]